MATFQSCLVYSNGVTVPSNMMNVVGKISGDKDSDSNYINKLFEVLFPEKYLKKQIKKGHNRKAILNKIRDSKKYDIMEGMIMNEAKFS